MIDLILIKYTEHGASARAGGGQASRTERVAGG